MKMDKVVIDGRELYELEYGNPGKRSGEMRVKLYFTMGPKRAALAVQLVRPKLVIPMHYGTFPILNGTPQELEQALKKRHSRAKVRVMKVDETLPL